MKKNILIMIFSLFVALSHPAHAAPEVNERMNMGAFAELPVLHEGRVKPVAIYARLKLKEFSGAETIDDISPEAWLAEVLFDPIAASNRPVFRIQDPHMCKKLNLTGRGLFSLNQLKNGLKNTWDQAESLMNTPPENLTPEQLSLLHLHDSALHFEELLRSFSMILPLNIDLPDRYTRSINFKPGEDINYERMFKIAPVMMDDLKKLIRRKGQNPEKYTPEEQSLAAAVFALERIAATGHDNNEFRIMPVDEKSKWAAPWEIVQGAGSPESAQYMNFWRAMAAAYRGNNAAAWAAQSRAALDYIQNVKKESFSPALFSLERFYNFIKPFHTSLVLYLIGACFAGVYLSRKRAFDGFAAPVVLTTAAAIHGFGILCRVIILGRPPVGTLYESVLFVSLVTALIGLGLFFRKRDMATAATGGVIAAALLILAPTVLQRGDNMEMLVAVLNTNFWLTVHVLCITMGYAVCIFAACLAHIYLATKSEPLARGTYVASLMALFLTALGTALGGVWADQSWGRFWGWDPKENGALLIVLWLIWLQHGRMSGALNKRAFMAGTAFLNIVVALAWFGVNLLNVGLHSYGFTEGLAVGLGAFCAVQITVIAALWFHHGRIKNRPRHAA